MKLGIIGFPQSGKTTLFNLLTGADAATRRVSRGEAARFLVEYERRFADLEQAVGADLRARGENP